MNESIRETRRIRRWKKIRADFAAARATGDIEEVMKVARREIKMYRNRQMARSKKQPGKIDGIVPVRNNTFECGRLSEVRRIRRWLRIRCEFAEARATGDLKEVKRVARKNNDARRARNKARRIKTQSEKSV